ncbi:MAG TPA: hypothetical protein VFA67_11040 [Candidatus Sulfotelmatobacter sp.]|nr:hypothetical protein [Candidatus Sulfotelmatobacter sp.]
MLRSSPSRWLLVLAGLLAVLPCPARGQEDPNETPLGDIARNLRKKEPAHPVIDDDNLTQVMQQADSRRGFGASLRFLMTGEGAGFRVSAPDVTCSLSFSGNAKYLLSGQYSEMDLPAGDLSKLEGHATVEGDALTVSVHNGTDWHLSEISVAFTLLNKISTLEASAAPGSLMPRLEVEALDTIRAEKKPDTTVIYHMRAPGLPWATAGFSAALNLEVPAGSEWHWAIVQARGYPPQNSGGMASPATPPAPVVTVPSSETPASSQAQVVPTASRVQNPQ